jgi:ankyrin repeat protein
MTSPKQQRGYEGTDIINEAERAEHAEHAELERLRSSLRELDGLTEYLDKVNQTATEVSQRTTTAESERDKALQRANQAENKLNQLGVVINHYAASAVLHPAAQVGDEPSIQLLLDCGIDNETKDSNGWTALHHAASNGHGSTVQLLIKTLGANMEAKYNRGSTSLISQP